MYEDDFFRNNTWIRDGKPHWAYNEPGYLVKVKDRDAIGWTPNTIASKVSINGKKAHIKLISDTPNLKEYQVKNSNSVAWQKTDRIFDVDLTEKGYELSFRAVNLANVSGPEHRVVIDSH
jgi:hypothetical protein